jgi:hypothetical protein
MMHGISVARVLERASRPEVGVEIHSRRAIPVGPAACTVRRRRRMRTMPRFQQETQKIQVLHPVSLRNQKAILSLPQLYRICTELPEHTVLSYFPLFIFDVICRKSEMLRLVRTSAIASFTRWNEKAGLPRDAIRSQCSTCSRHNEKETGNEKG